MAEAWPRSKQSPFFAPSRERTVSRMAWLSGGPFFRVTMPTISRSGRKDFAHLVASSMLGFRTDPSAAMKAEKRNPVGPRTPETYCWKGQAIVKDHPRANQALPPCLHRAWLESSEELSDPRTVRATAIGRVAAITIVTARIT